MIDHVWTVVCSRAVIDRESNNVSLQNIIEQITIGGEPMPDAMVPIPLEVMTLWVRANTDIPSRARTRLTFLSPSDTVLGSAESEVDLSEYERYRVRMHFQGLPVTEPGRYTFHMELQNEGESEWHQVAAIPLRIIFMPPDTEQTGGKPE
jgi:hypothetical protein